MYQQYPLFLRGKADVFDGGDSSPPLLGAFGAGRKATSGGCGDEGSDCGRVVAHRDMSTARQRRKMSPGREFVQVTGLRTERKLRSSYQAEEKIRRKEEDLNECMQSIMYSVAAAVKQFFTKLHGHQSKTLALFVLGAIKAESIVLQRVAEALLAESEAKVSSIERCLQRFLSNEKIETKKTWDDFLKHILPYFRAEPIFTRIKYSISWSPIK